MPNFINDVLLYILEQTQYSLCVIVTITHFHADDLSWGKVQGVELVLEMSCGWNLAVSPVCGWARTDRMPLPCHVMPVSLGIRRGMRCGPCPWAIHSLVSPGSQSELTVASIQVWMELSGPRGSRPSIAWYIQEFSTEKGTQTWQWRRELERNREASQGRKNTISKRAEVLKRKICVFILLCRKYFLSTSVNTPMSKAVSFCLSLLSI